MILLIQIHYRSNSVKRGNLLNLPFCNEVQADCIHHALDYTHSFKYQPIFTKHLLYAWNYSRGTTDKRDRQQIKKIHMLTGDRY